MGAREKGTERNMEENHPSWTSVRMFIARDGRGWDWFDSFGWFEWASHVIYARGINCYPKEVRSWSLMYTDSFLNGHSLAGEGKIVYHYISL